MDLIFENYMNNVIDHGKKLLRTKKYKPERIVTFLTSEYHLNPREESIVKSRLMNGLREDENMVDSEQVTETTDPTVIEDELVVPETAKQYRIDFDKEEDFSKAIGILMMRKIAWSQKGSDENGFFVQFDSKNELKNAKDALSKKWDFVDSASRKVAVIEFDNLQDFYEVSSWMKSKKMVSEAIVCDDLDEDLVVESINKADDAAKYTINNLPSPDSVKAISKNGSSKAEAASVFEDKNARGIRIRKKW